MGTLNVFKIPWLEIKLADPPPFDRERWELVQIKDERFIKADRRALRQIDGTKYKLLNLITNETTLVDKTGDYRADRDNIKKAVMQMKPILEKRIKRSDKDNSYVRYGFRWQDKDEELVKKVGLYLKSLKPESAKIPLLNSNYVGIELEFGCFVGINTMVELFREAKLEKKIQFKGDGSIHCGEYQVELACILHEKKLDDIKTICGIINGNDVRAMTDHSCGLHVHIDMRNRDKDKVKNRFINMENILYAMMPGPRRENRFCRRNSLVPNPEPGDRYFALNTLAYEKHHTYEIRLHYGTTSANRIIQWVKLLIAIADTPQLGEENINLIGGFGEMKERVSFGEELEAYIRHEMVVYNG